MSPLSTTSAYSNNIYSKQFAELVLDHLKPDGILTMWTDEFDVMSKTLLSVFPDVQLYRWKLEGFYLASPTQMRQQNVKRVSALLHSFPSKNKAGILHALTVRQVISSSSLTAHLRNLVINEDWKPNVEYYMGLGWKKGRGH